MENISRADWADWEILDSLDGRNMNDATGSHCVKETRRHSKWALLGGASSPESGMKGPPCQVPASPLFSPSTRWWMALLRDSQSLGSEILLSAPLTHIDLGLGDVAKGPEARWPLGRTGEQEQRKEETSSNDYQGGALWGRGCRVPGKVAWEGHSSGWGAATAFFRWFIPDQWFFGN